MAVTYPMVTITENNLYEVVEQLSEIPFNAEKVEIDLRAYPSARPHIMTALTSFISSHPHTSFTVYFPQFSDVHNYMTRMKFYEKNRFRVQYPYYERPSAGRFIELTTFNKTNQDDIVDQVTRCLENLGVSANMQRALAFSFSELIDNACSHSESSFDGVICAQKLSNRLHLSIADRGIGIPKSLEDHPNCVGLSDEGILLESVKKQVSSKLTKGIGGHLGNGLFRINTITQLTQGELYICSRNGLLTTAFGKTSSRWNNFAWNGTMIYIVLPDLPTNRWEEIFEIVFPDDDTPRVPHLDKDYFF